MDKNRIMMIVIIALLVILLGTIAFVSIYAINFFKNNPINGDSQIGATNNKNEAAVIVQDKLLIVDYSSAIKAIINESDKATHGLTFKVSIGIDNSDKKQEKAATELQELLSSRETVVKSFITEIIYNHTHEEYSNNNDSMQKTLSSEILERLQLEFGSNLLVIVYLSEYVYQ